MTDPAGRHGTENGGTAGGGDLGGRKLPILLIFGGGVFLLDVVTKWIVQQTLPLGRSVEVLGDVFRLTHIMNPGAAFGLHIGEHSRLVFILLTICALLFLGGMYWYAARRDYLRLVAVSLLVGGALGNLLDRVRFPEGVVDFLDVGFGTMRWPVFNVADMGITVGAVLLAVSIWQEEREVHRSEDGVDEKAARSPSS